MSVHHVILQDIATRSPLKNWSFSEKHVEDHFAVNLKLCPEIKSVKKHVRTLAQGSG